MAGNMSVDVCVIYCLLGLLTTLQNFSCQTEPPLQLLAQEFWDWRNTEFPALHNPKSPLVESFALDRFQQRVKKADEFLKRTRGFDVTSLSRDDKLTLRLLENQLQTYRDGYEWLEYGVINPINMLESTHGLSHIWATRDVYTTYEEYMMYIEKLNKVPKQIQEIQTLMSRAVQLGRTNHAVSMNGVVESIFELGNETPTDSLYFTNFNELQSSIAISSNDKKTLITRGINAIQRIQTELIRLARWIRAEYMPHTRKHEGVWSLTNGNEYYRAALRWHLSMDMHPETVHQTGLAEVMRIKHKMENVMSFIGFSGNLTSFFKYLRSEKKFYNHTKEQYLDLYKDAVYHKIKPNLHLFFPNIEDIPELDIIRSHKDALMASYWFPVMQVNTNNPHTRENFTVLAISLHEGLPGHHLQVSYMRSQNLPDFRRYFNAIHKFSVPFNFPYYTAYVEGWGLYAEYMGEEMGVFTDPYELFGRYCFEIFRACRLVVDTGIHHKGWTRRQAVQYMLRHTFIAPEMIEMEVDRYITWPGQACAYKIGELKFKELKNRAEKELGFQFNIIEFHDVLLKVGSVPLDMLEDIVDEWINSKLDLIPNISSYISYTLSYWLTSVCLWFNSRT